MQSGFFVLGNTPFNSPARLGVWRGAGVLMRPLGCLGSEANEMAMINDDGDDDDQAPASHDARQLLDSAMAASKNTPGFSCPNPKLIIAKLKTSYLLSFP